MPQALFNPQGGRLVASVTTNAQIGSYTVLLWENNENTVVWQQQGNFMNTDDDSHQLPPKTGGQSVNDGRIVDCVFSIIPPEGGAYWCKLCISQDGNELAEDSFNGQTDQHTISIRLFVNLVDVTKGAQS